MRSLHRRALCLIAMTVLLQACSLMPQSPDAVPQSDVAREQLQQWTMKARLATADNRALMRWNQQAENFNILLRGPFGMGGVRIVGNPQRAEIDDGDELVVSLDPQADIYKQTGIWVPVAALPYWLRALPAPGAKAQIQRDELGQISRLEQFGWRVDYAGWQLQEPRDVAMPMSLQLSRDEPVLSLEINRWILP